jgi:hypothetical protein
MFLFLFLVQLSLWLYGRSVVVAAAQHGLDAARTADPDAAGAARADAAVAVGEFLAQTGGLEEGASDVTVTGTATEVTVTVEARAVTVLDLVEGNWTISVTMSGPIEQVVE